LIDPVLPQDMEPAALDLAQTDLDSCANNSLCGAPPSALMHYNIHKISYLNVKKNYLQNILEFLAFLR